MIRYYRKSRRMNQNELSEKSNVDVYVIRKIEKGDISPTLDDLCKIAKALNVDSYKLIKEILNKENECEYAEEFFTFF